MTLSHVQSSHNTPGLNGELQLLRQALLAHPGYVWTALQLPQAAETWFAANAWPSATVL